MSSPVRWRQRRLGILPFSCSQQPGRQSLTEARAVIERSFEPELVEPEDPEPWNAAYKRFQQYCELGRT